MTVDVVAAWTQYQELKALWLKDNPQATPEQIEAFCKRLAKELGL